MDAETLINSTDQEIEEFIRQHANLSEALQKIRQYSIVDYGQRKAPTKQDYKNAMVAIHRWAEQATAKAQ